MNRVAIISARAAQWIRHNTSSLRRQTDHRDSIEAALQSALFDRVIVFIDYAQIAEVARTFGAEIPFLRPAGLADDFAGTNAVIKHGLTWLLESGAPADYACCIYATAPLLRADDLRDGYRRLVELGKSYAFAVTSFAFPVQRALRINHDGCVEALYPEMIPLRSQDLEEAYHDAGQFYWGRAEAFMNDVVTFSPESVPVVLPRHRVQDIDTLEDWRRAELMYAALQEHEA